MTRDHPRARGEQILLVIDEAQLLGSSPRARGAGDIPYMDDFGRGIIPARAGSSSEGKSAGRWARDHPRARGEQETQRNVQEPSLGSSPRARGAAN